MLSTSLISSLESAVRETLGNDFRIESVEPVSGGDINTAVRLSGPHGNVFAKIRQIENETMFESEAKGLQALETCEAIRVPKVLSRGKTEESAFLLMEWLDIRPLREETEANRAGEALAALHHITQSQYGWPCDNYIGSNLQHNHEGINWAQFFITDRLKPQFEMAAERGFKGTMQRNAESIYAKLPALFLEYHPEASLLHGDLWSGNLGCLPDGSPVLFDPACYYGDRETDLAMTELFGGLPLAFYAAYRRSWPLDKDYERRKPAYNLYHILNHLNLFGRGYLSQAERLTAQLAKNLGH